MSEEVKCPNCQYEYPYPDGDNWVCPDCQHTWNPAALATEAAKVPEIKDSNGNVLADGDTVTVIKDLKIKGASGSVKVGTKVKNIRLVYDSGDGHDIACKIEGFGAMNLKSEFVKKV
jgi:protein PhnA